MNTPAESIVNGSAAMLKQLPSLDRFLKLPDAQSLVADFGLTQVTEQSRRFFASLRTSLQAGEAIDLKAFNEAGWSAAIRKHCTELTAPHMRSVINLTGTVIHTNLGRSVLGESVMQFVTAMMSGPNNLEYDLESGSRGDRDSLVEDLICRITGAEAATVVNNNAAAVLLTIAALAGGKESIVSRGELVEIGGAFRMPDVMRSAGSTLVEVGTTNRTHLRDYAQAITAQTGILMKVHTSNYVVQGFTHEVSEAELAPLAKETGVPLVSDLGSGALVDLSRWGLPKEPLPQEALADGCDVVTFSGDKLLGGPQAGIIVGRKDLIERIRRFPMKRALRLSKLPFAALEATLRLYLNPDSLLQALPTLRWLTRSVDDIARRVQAVEKPVSDALSPRYSVSVAHMKSQIGSGSLPIDVIPSLGLRIEPVEARKRGTALEALAAALRECPVPVIGRIAEDALWLDCRCLEDTAQLVAQFQHVRERLI